MAPRMWAYAHGDLSGGGGIGSPLRGSPSSLPPVARFEPPWAYAHRDFSGGGGIGSPLRGSPSSLPPVARFEPPWAYAHRDFSGGGGIRTHVGYSPAGFQDRCIQPLCHPSGGRPGPRMRILGGTGALLAGQDTAVRAVNPSGRVGQRVAGTGLASLAFRRCRNHVGMWDRTSGVGCPETVWAGPFRLRVDTGSWIGGTHTGGRANGDKR